MASTYVNDLRLNEMGTGDASGSWGTATNTNLELIGEAMGYGTEAVANASTHTITMADGATDGFRCTFLRLTGGGQACTVTLAPNTLSHTWIIRNTTGYALTFTQGSGANVIIAAGLAKMVTTDGLGSGAVVYECLEALELGTINGGVAPSYFEGKNRIDNPSGVINQRGAQTGLVSGWVADRWYFATLSPSVVSTNTVSGYIEVDVTTADTSIAAGDLAYLQQSIEGFNTSDLLIGTASAKTITISFKHKHTKTGINCVALGNSAANRAYIFEYTQSSSNAPETHSETITLDTAGTWIGDTNGIGLKIVFGLMSGTDYHGAADTWLAANDFVTSNQVNNMDSTSNYFRITDVQLEVGTVATPLEYETYSQTLAKCQRYLPALKATADDQAMGLVGQPYSTTVAIVPILFPYKPRASITGITISASTHFALTGAASNRIDSTAVVYGNGGLDGIWISVTVASGIVAGNAVTLWSANAGAFILFTGAEL